MKDNRLMLAMHIAALARESIVLKDAKAEAQGQERHEDAQHLHNWRVVRLRNQLRLHNLAYGYIVGRTLDEMEQPLKSKRARKPIDMTELRGLLFTYGWPTMRKADIFKQDGMLLERLDDFNKKRRSEWALTRLRRLSEKIGEELCRRGLSNPRKVR